MIQYEKPMYCLMCLILVFIFLWFFFGGKDYDFVGLRPLNPDHIMDYQDSYRADKRIKQDNIEEVEEEDQSEFVNDDEDICIDSTPNLPIEFNKPTCEYGNDDGKFTSKGEKICRETMEKIYGVEFKNTRPTWLKNVKTGRCLELDCYNEQLKLAVEYDGKHHHVYPNFLKQSFKEFKNQQYRDQLKKELCKKHGVHLINVPYNVNFELIPTYIMYHLPEIIQRRLKNDQILDL